MHDSRTIANEFLRLAAERHTGLTSTQVLKLVYIAHGWSLALLGKPLIGDEIQAWQFAERTALLLWLPRLSMMTMSPGRRVGTRTAST